MTCIQKKLVILTPGFPKDENDTTCLPFHQAFICSLKENFPHLTILIFAFQYPYRIDQYNWKGITVFSFNGKNKGGIARLLLRKKILNKLEQIYTPPDNYVLLSLWYGECAWIGKQFAAGKNLKHFCWLQGQDAKKENKYPSKVKLNQEEIIALSDFLQEKFEINHGIRPLHVIPPGIYFPQQRGNNISKTIDIAGAGSLIPLKQYEIFIEAIAFLKKSYPEIKAELIGKGTEKKKLACMIRQLKLEKNILLTGELPHAETMQKMKQSRIFLHPSNYEGFSLVCLEALSTGARVISFHKPMKTEIRNWHTVSTASEMINLALTLLNKPMEITDEANPYKIGTTVSSIITLLFE